jgi:class 3 adenylate cyclase
LAVEEGRESLRAAHAIRAELAEHGLQIRVGLHTGEVELVGDDIGGIAVHIAARVLSQAGAAEIVCSRTVRTWLPGPASPSLSGPLPAQGRRGPMAAVRGPTAPAAA